MGEDLEESMGNKHRGEQNVLCLFISLGVRSERPRELQRRNNMEQRLCHVPMYKVEK